MSVPDRHLCKCGCERLARIRLYHKIEGTIPAPTIDLEIAIERENATGPIFIGHVDQTSVGEVHGYAREFLQETSHPRGSTRQTIRDEKRTSVDIFEHGIDGLLDRPQEITGLRDNRLASDQRGFDFGDGRGALLMTQFGTVQECDDKPRIQENRRQRPNPFK